MSRPSRRSTRRCATRCAPRSRSRSRPSPRARTSGRSCSCAARRRPRSGTLGDPDLDRVVARDALGELEAGPHVDPALRRARRGARRHGVGVHRVVRAAAAHGDLRRGRLHRAAGQRSPRCSATAWSCATPAPVFATGSGFPMADEVVNEWPNRYLEKVGDDLGPRDAVCVLTHDSKFDVPAIVGSLATGVGYLGAMGSRTTHAKRTERLQRGGRHRRAARPHPGADRPRHRRPHAGGDRGVDLRRDHQRPHRARRRRPCATRAGRSTRELGIEGRRGRGGGGVERARASRPPRALADEGVTVAICSRSQRADRGRGGGDRSARGAAGRRRLDRGGRGGVRAGTRATRWAGSTSSCATAAVRPRATSRRTAPEAYRAAIELNCLSPHRDVQRGGPGDARAAVGEGDRDHVGRRAPADRGPDPLQRRACRVSPRSSRRSPARSPATASP